MTSASADFFKQENLFVTLFIISGLFGIVPIVGLNIENEYIPIWIMKHHEMAWTTFKYCISIHIFESFIAFVLCGFYYGMTFKTTFKWTLSTFIHGFFSLRHLVF